MTTYKRIDGDYYIQTIDAPTQKVYIDTDTTVTGNLTVQGNLTYINVDELNITDPFIVLNASNTSTYASNSGVLTHKTESDFAGIRYNETSGLWEVSSSTNNQGTSGTWLNIATGAPVSPGGSNTYVQFNEDGIFGGNINLRFDYSLGELALQGYELFGNIGTAPSPVANSVAIYHNAEGSGGTGLYVKSPTVEDELVSKSKAIVFSIIF